MNSRFSWLVLVFAGCLLLAAMMVLAVQPAYVDEPRNAPGCDQPVGGDDNPAIWLVSDSPAYVAEPVHFTATVTGTAPFTCTWDFGDESALFGETIATNTFFVSHTYLAVGTFVTTLYVTPSQGVMMSETTYVEVVSPFLGIALAFSPGPVVGQPVILTATMDGGKTPYSYTWHFGDNSDPQAGLAPAGVFTTSHPYPSAGIFGVTLAVTDALRTALSQTVQIEVECPPLAVDLTSTQPAQAGEPVAFTGTVTGGAAPFAYAWDYGDDGPGETGTSGVPTIGGLHRYGAGLYTVTLAVTDTYGCSAPLAETTVEITNTWCYLPVMLKNYTPPLPPPPVLIVNGGFEEADLGGWDSGGELPAMVVSSLFTGTVYSGSYVALLGHPAYGDGSSGNVPVGRGWISQTVTIPDGDTATLSLAYRMQGWDGLNNDRFRACLLNTVTLQEICFYDTFEDYAGTFKDTGWQIRPVNINPGWRTVQVRLEHLNEVDGYWNTWTYVDEVRVILEP